MYPDWVVKQRQKGTNISCINGKYYLYAVSSVWNKEKGRAQKITGEYLGRITEDGLISPKKKIAKLDASITVKEYGATNVLCEIGADIIEKLHETFGEQGDQIFALAAIRMMDACPFKRVEHIYENSFLSEKFKGLRLSKDDLTAFLRTFGCNREKIVEFMQSFFSGNKHILFDGTSIVSKSEKMGINRKGYNAHGDYDPQVNLLYAFACESKTPVYYRIVAGNIRDVTALKQSINETAIKDMVVVADKGFGSEANFSMMEAANIKYIVPLRRNSSQIDTTKLETGNKADFDDFFMFNERPIWYYQNNDITVYLDNDMKIEEEKAYLKNIENNIEGFTKEGFINKQYIFGTISIKTNIKKTPSEIYFLYKERREIEQSFDFLKNLLEQDKSYMQNEKSLETWAFINHISLMLNYKIYNVLREKKLLSKFSVADFLSHLKYISKIKSGNTWYLSEFTRKTEKFLSYLDLHIT